MTISSRLQKRIPRLLLLYRYLLAASAVTGLGTPLAAPAVSNPEAERYELRGRIVAERGTFRRALPLVLLHASTHPFKAETLADPGGRFKIKNLPAGLYTVTIVLPGRGEVQETLDIGPKSADSRRRMEVEFELDGPAFVLSRNTISAVALSVPEKARRLFQKAQERLKKSDAQGAVGFLQQAVEIAPQYVDAWNNLGTLANQNGDYVLAERYFREALAKDPTAFAPLVNLGGALLSQRRAADSLDFNVQAARMRPADALANSQLGQTYYFLGQLEQAERYLRLAKTLDPGHFSFPQLVLADIHRHKRQFASCNAELDEFFRYHPNPERIPAMAAHLRQACSRVEGGRP